MKQERRNGERMRKCSTGSSQPMTSTLSTGSGQNMSRCAYNDIILVISLRSKISACLNPAATLDTLSHNPVQKFQSNVTEDAQTEINMTF